MTPKENIRWYWEDLSTHEKIHLLSELYLGLDEKARNEFIKLTSNN